jgi:hypothetical protein
MNKGNYDIDFKKLEDHYKMIRESYLKSVDKFIKYLKIALFVTAILLIAIVILT